MTRPDSPRALLSWAASVCDSFHRPRPARYEYTGIRDPRVSYTRETAVSVVRILERCANGNGGGGLLFDHYVLDIPLEVFTAREQRIIARTARAFASRLREAGFLCGEG